ncbi:MAG: GNAT family N-acetyltransferase [Chloroflexia bacterium]
MEAPFSSTDNPTQEADWYVRPYRMGDEDGLLALYERAFRRPRDVRHWRWKLLGRRATYNLLWVAAVRGGDTIAGERIVGHYGGIPIRIKLRGEVQQAVHAVEAMTDPLFRRKGMLTTLGGTSHSTWAEAGRRLVTGLPNDQWGTRNRALGYLPVFPLSWLRFPLHLERALARRRSIPALLRVAGYLPSLAASAAWKLAAHVRNAHTDGNVRVETVAEDSTVFDAIWAHASEGWLNIQVRDNDWVRWRFLQAAPTPYKVAVAYKSDSGKSPHPVGYAAFRVVDHGERRNGYLADLFVARGDDATAWALIKFALLQMSAEDAGTVMTLAPPGSSLYATLRTCGFLPTRAETAFSFEIVPLDQAISVEALSDPAEWHLTGGDFDVI